MEDAKVMLPRDDPKPEGDWPKPDAQPDGGTGGDVDVPRDPDDPGRM